MAYLEAQPDRTSAITFEFGKHIDIYFGNLEGHGSFLVIMSRDQQKDNVHIFRCDNAIASLDLGYESP